MRLAYLAPVALLAACSTPPDDVVMTRVYPVPYERLGACLYDHLDREYPSHIRLADLRGSASVRITMDQQGVRPWEISISQADAVSSTVAIKAVPTVQGRNFYAQQLAPAIDACAQAAGPAVAARPPVRGRAPR